MPLPIRILLVDDHFMVRLGLIGAFAADTDLLVVGEAASGAEAIDAHARLLPDITLMDGLLPDIHGVVAMQRILETQPDAKVIMLSINESADDVQRALQAGASGYVPKTSQKDMIATAIRTVAAGKKFLPPALARLLDAHLAHPELSARELDVLRLAAKGLANKQIATELAISEATVKSHIAHILNKLNVPDRTSAVTMALQRGLLRP